MVTTNARTPNSAITYFRFFRKSSSESPALGKRRTKNIEAREFNARARRNVLPAFFQGPDFRARLSKKPKSLIAQV